MSRIKKELVTTPLGGITKDYEYGIYGLERVVYRKGDISKLMNDINNEKIIAIEEYKYHNEDISIVRINSEDILGCTCTQRVNRDGNILHQNYDNEMNNIYCYEKGKLIWFTHNNDYREEYEYDRNLLKTKFIFYRDERVGLEKYFYKKNKLTQVITDYGGHYYIEYSKDGSISNVSNYYYNEDSNAYLETFIEIDRIIDEDGRQTYIQNINNGEIDEIIVFDPMGNIIAHSRFINKKFDFLLLAEYEYSIILDKI